MERIVNFVYFRMIMQIPSPIGPYRRWAKLRYGRSAASLEVNGEGGGRIVRTILLSATPVLLSQYREFIKDHCRRAEGSTSETESRHPNGWQLVDTSGTVYIKHSLDATKDDSERPTTSREAPWRGGSESGSEEEANQRKSRVYYESSDEDEEDEFEVEKLLQSRMAGRKKEYLVKVGLGEVKRQGTIWGFSGKTMRRRKQLGSQLESSAGGA